MTPASFDFCRANLKRGASSSGISIPSDSLNPTARLLPVLDRVHHVDRQPGLVEHVGHPDAFDFEGGHLERARLDDDVALLLEDARHPVERIRSLVRGSRR